MVGVQKYLIFKLTQVTQFRMKANKTYIFGNVSTFLWEAELLGGNLPKENPFNLHTHWKIGQYRLNLTRKLLNLKRKKKLQLNPLQDRVAENKIPAGGDSNDLAKNWSEISNFYRKQIKLASVRVPASYQKN